LVGGFVGGGELNSAILFGQTFWLFDGTLPNTFIRVVL
jgi:hypothetical protein